MLNNYKWVRLRFITCVLTLFAGLSCAGAQKIYVDLNAVGANNGSSWSDAYTDLQDALENAVTDDSIWVAAGTYYPAFSSRDSFFDIPHRVYLYGGFDGTETQLDQRDLAANICILSGDIDKNGVRDAGNSYTVVYFKLLCDYSLIDGFVITGGNADGPGDLQRNGGAVYIDGGINNGGIPFILNTTFENNYAVNFGGAIYANGLNGGYAHYVLESCKFISNTGIFNGGAIQNDGTSSPAIVNCEFTSNLSSYGGAIYNNGSDAICSPSIVNCIFSGNRAFQTGGVLFNFGNGASGVSSPILLNCLIYDNTSDISAAGLYSLTDGGISEMDVINTTFYNNNATVNGGHVYVNESNSGLTETTLRNCILWGSVSGSGPYFAFSQSGGGNPKVNIDYALVDAPDCASMREGTTGTLTCGANMLYNEDPLFEDEINRDFRLQSTSPGVHYGDSTLLPMDFFDFDIDGNTTELVPVDLAWNMRVEGDDIDLGPYESGSPAAPIGVLPVELLSFTARAEGGKVALNWVTLSEDNNDYFTIERSTNGRDFEAIHREEGAGTSIFARNYMFYDNNPFAGENYYRLKQTDLDGRFEYSDIRIVTILEEGQITTYPNPVTKVLHVALSDFKVKEVGYEIYHLSGKLMHRGQVEVNKGIIVIDLQEAEQLIPGSYIIRIVNPKGGDLYGKFVKVGL